MSPAADPSAKPAVSGAVSRPATLAQCHEVIQAQAQAQRLFALERQLAELQERLKLNSRNSHFLGDAFAAPAFEGAAEVDTDHFSQYAATRRPRGGSSRSISGPSCRATSCSTPRSGCA